jgi:hypothetical protein
MILIPLKKDAYEEKAGILGYRQMAIKLNRENNLHLMEPSMIIEKGKEQWISHSIRGVGMPINKGFSDVASHSWLLSRRC